jgi:hypothetical protein
VCHVVCGPRCGVWDVLHPLNVAVNGVYVNMCDVWPRMWCKVLCCVVARLGVSCICCVTQTTVETAIVGRVDLELCSCLNYHSF